jgi:hypothetical protein
MSSELIKNDNKKIANLHFKLTGEKELPKLTYLCKNEKEKFIGYFCFHYIKYGIFLDWIYAPNNGIKVMNNLIGLCHIIDDNEYKIDHIYLHCSIDPTEKKSTVIKRINFWQKCKFKVYDIEFRKKFGPLFYMKRAIWKNNRIDYIDI